MQRVTERLHRSQFAMICSVQKCRSPFFPWRRSGMRTSMGPLWECRWSQSSVPRRGLRAAKWLPCAGGNWNFRRALGRHTVRRHMKVRPTPLPRKQPSQERSKSTVTSILQAASEVILQSGREQATVAAVVRRAGVSAGTFYQYFPNKEALLAAVVQQQLDGVDESIRSQLRLVPHGSLPALLQATARASIKAWRQAIPVLQAVLQPARRREDPDHRTSLLHDLMEQPVMTKVEPEKRYMVALLVETLTGALVQRAALENPQMLDLLEDELVVLLTACVRHAVPGRGAT